MIAELAATWRLTLAVTLGLPSRSEPIQLPGMEERRAHRRFQAGLVAQQPVVETAVDLGDGVEQRVIEDVEDGIGFLDRRGLLQRDRGRAEQGVDLV